MKILNHTIVGSGLSALIKHQLNPKSTVYSLNKNKIFKSTRFYENLKMGGNSNIWGGYINFKIFSKFLKDRKFKKFYRKQKIFKLVKLFNSKRFVNTYFIANYLNNNIFRINKIHFKNSIITNKIEKISFKRNRIILLTNKKKIFTKKLSLCIGNLSLLKLMYDSKMIGLKDKITFLDGKVSYGLNFFLNFEKNYYIPMTLLEIIEKLIFGKKIKYKKKINNTLIVQKFTKKYKKYSYSVDKILSYKNNFIRFFLSNHPTNVKINNIPIGTYLKNYSKNIYVYNSGTIRKYIPGPISQNLIFNIIKNEIK